MTASTIHKALFPASLLASTIVLAFCCLTGCTGSTPAESQSRESEPATSMAQSASPLAASAQSESPTVLLAYFSRAGENYQTESTEVGNTAVVAGFIEGALDCDVYEITPAEPYPFGYEDTKVRARQELDGDARPALSQEVPDLDGYDIVLLGSPIWYGAEPMAVRTFLESENFAGKTIYPFTTHGGSGLGSVIANYRELAPNASVSDNGLAITGSNAQGAREEVITWLEQIGLLPQQ